MTAGQQAETITSQSQELINYNAVYLNSDPIINPGLLSTKNTKATLSRSN